MRRPPLTKKTLSGLLELVAFVESVEPSVILGDDPIAWEGTPQGKELKARLEAIRSACLWIEKLQEFKALKDKRRRTS